jgi:ABC-2 type transport system permease protein
MGRLRIAAVIAGNQLHRMSLDRSYLLLGIVLPLVLVLVAGGSNPPQLGGRGFVPTRPYAVALVAGDSAARQAVATALGDAEAYVRVTTVAAAEDARRDVLERRSDVAVIVPEGFPVTPLTLVGAPGSVSIEVVAGVIGEVLDADAALVGAALGAAPVPVATTVVAAAVPDEVPTGVGAAWREASSYGYFSVALAVFFALIGAHTGLIVHAASARDGLAARMRAVGVDRVTHTLGGVMASTAYVALVLAAVALGSWALFGVDWGSPLGWLALTAVGAVAFVALNLLVLAVLPRPATFESLGVVANMAVAMLGGTMVPLFVLPDALVSRFTWLPTRTLLDGYFALSVGGGWTDLRGPLLRTALAAAVALALAAIVSMARAAREDR